jgi:hypothetical protein
LLAPVRSIHVCDGPRRDIDTGDTMSSFCARMILHEAYTIGP